MLERKENETPVTARDSGIGVRDKIAEFRPESIGGMRQGIKEFGGELILRKVHLRTIVEFVIPIASTPSAIRAVPITAV